MIFLYVAVAFVLIGLVAGMFFLCNWLMKGENDVPQKKITPKEIPRENGHG